MKKSVQQVYVLMDVIVLILKNIVSMDALKVAIVYLNLYANQVIVKEVVIVYLKQEFNVLRIHV